MTHLPSFAHAEFAAKESVQVVEKIKASVRAYVEHPFDLVKNIFQHGKVRYRGLAKNGHQLKFGKMALFSASLNVDGTNLDGDRRDACPTSMARPTPSHPTE